MLLYAAFMFNPRILNKIDAYWNELFSPLLKRLKNHLLANVDLLTLLVKVFHSIQKTSFCERFSLLRQRMLVTVSPICSFQKQSHAYSEIYGIMNYAILTQWLFKGRVYSVTYSRFFSMLSSVRLRRKKNGSDIKSSSKVTLKLNQDFTLTFKALNDLVPPYLSFRPPSS